MADISTKKDALIIGDTNTKFIDFRIEKSGIIILVKNECVTHHVSVAPQEAIQMGVALIQMAAMFRK